MPRLSFIVPVYNVAPYLRKCVDSLLAQDYDNYEIILVDDGSTDEYHDVAATELAKVDWPKQPKSAKAQYTKPIWLLKAQRRFMQIGSYCKQKLIKILTK